MRAVQIERSEGRARKKRKELCQERVRGGGGGGGENEKIEN